MDVILGPKVTSKRRMDGFNHTFPALRGAQAGAEFYVAMCPMRLLPKLFVFDDDEVPPELRAQRTLNRHRIPEIARYLIQNRTSYVVSALTASVDQSVGFIPLGNGNGRETVGTLELPMDARLLINDGQHRRAAVEEAMAECPALRDDHVPVIFFVDRGLKRSQQMFADLNKHAIRPSDSLSTLYDQRDPSSELARYVALTVDGFKGMTEMERSSLSNRSTKLFTLSSIKTASRVLLQKRRNDNISLEERAFAAAFWSAVFDAIPDWRLAKERKVATGDLRRNYVHAHGIALSAIATAGADLVTACPKRWRARLRRLATVDWSRTNRELWEGRAMQHGRISKAKTNIRLTVQPTQEAHGTRVSPPEERALEREPGRPTMAEAFPVRFHSERRPKALAPAGPPAQGPVRARCATSTSRTTGRGSSASAAARTRPPILQLVYSAAALAAHPSAGPSACSWSLRTRWWRHPVVVDLLAPHPG